MGFDDYLKGKMAELLNMVQAPLVKARAEYKQGLYNVCAYQALEWSKAVCLLAILQLAEFPVLIKKLKKARPIYLHSHPIVFIPILTQSPTDPMHPSAEVSYHA